MNPGNKHRSREREQATPIANVRQVFFYGWLRRLQNTGMARDPRRWRFLIRSLVDDKLLVVVVAFEYQFDVVDGFEAATETELHDRVGGVLLR